MKHLIFLHGALGSARQWNFVSDRFKDKYEVHVIDFPGHGNLSDSSKAESLSELCTYTDNYIKEHVQGDFIIIGYSMGGYVGLKLASEGLKGLSKLITIATKTTWSPEIAEKESASLNAETLKPIEGKLLMEHGENWIQLLEHTKSILRSIGECPLLTLDMQKISVPLRMLLGEKDKMVSVEETERFAMSAVQGSFKILPSQGHLLERMEPEVLYPELLSFIQ